MTVPVLPALAGLVTSVGSDRLLGDPVLCQHLLNDLMPGRVDEVSALVAAVETGTAHRLTGRRPDLGALSRRLAATGGLDAVRAEWAVRTWDEALRLSAVTPRVDPVTSTVSEPGTAAAPVTPAGLARRARHTYALVGALVAAGLVLAGTVVWTGVRIVHWAQPSHQPAPPVFTSPLTPDGRYAYIAGGQPTVAGTVSVLDTNTNQVIKTIMVGKFPGDATVSPDGARVYVPNSADGTVSVINTATNTVVATIAVGAAPGDVVLAHDGSLGLVTNYAQGASTVTFFDTASDTRLTSVRVGRNPGDVVLTRDEFGLVTNYADRTVSVLDLKTAQIAATVPVGQNPSDAVVAPDRPTAYVTNDAAPGSISVIDLTNWHVSTITVGTNPEPIVLGDNGRAYVTNYRDNSVAVLNTDTDTVVKVLPVGAGPSAMTIDASGERGYITNIQAATVTVLNLDRQDVAATVRVGSHPDGVFLSNDDAQIYVHNHEDLSNNAPGSNLSVTQTISTIDAHSDTVVKTSPIGHDVNYATLAPDGVHVYIAHGNASVTVTSLQ